MVGVDIAEKEVMHARTRAVARSNPNQNSENNNNNNKNSNVSNSTTTNNNNDGTLSFNFPQLIDPMYLKRHQAPKDSAVDFVVGDMCRKIPIASGSMDVCISNGAFCLASDKEKAFSEVYRCLRPGGRMSICTSTVRGADSLKKKTNVNINENGNGNANVEEEEEEEWPICMRMFIEIDELKPLCESLGFVNVVIDTSDSLMSFREEELEKLTEEELSILRDGDPDSGGDRHKIHSGSPEFKHLEKYDMNELCARVVVYAEKPEDEDAQ